MENKYEKIVLGFFLVLLYIAGAWIGYGLLGISFGYIFLLIGCFTIGPWSGIIGVLGSIAEMFFFIKPFEVNLGYIAMITVIGILFGFIADMLDLDKKEKYRKMIIWLVFSILISIIAGTILNGAIKQETANFEYLKTELVFFGIKALFVLGEGFLVVPASKFIRKLVGYEKFNKTSNGEPYIGYKL